MVQGSTTSRSFQLVKASVSITLLLMLITATATYADRRGTAKRRGAPPPRTSSSVSAPYQQAQPSIPRRLLPPAGLGSAANVPSGFYRQLNAPSPTHQGGGGVVAPNVVYVYPYPSYDVAPVGLDNSSSPSRSNNPNQPIYVTAPPNTPQAQPIYVTRDDPAATGGRQNPQPVYIVDRPDPRAATPRRQAEPEPPPAPQKPPTPKKASPVTFNIQPVDAVAYLDDDRLGSGESLAALLEGLVLDPGVHVLEITHPQFKTQRLVFGVSSGEPMEVIVDLAAATPQRRSRVR